MSLRGFSPESPPAELRLRLLHAWKLGNPATPDQFFAYGTLWTDNQGVLIQGDSHRNFTSVLQKRVAVGSVYVVSNFSVRSPRPSFRTCAFPHCLGITASTKFELQQSPEPPFLSNAFDFVPIASLPARAHPCPYLSDFIDKVIGAGEPNHIERNFVVSPVQKLNVTDASGAEVDVSLWAELSSILDAGTIVIDDQERPLIVGFAGFRIGSFDGKTTEGSSPTSRVIVQPNHATADALRTLFTTKARPITYTPPKFNTPEKLKKHVEDSYRTIHELHVMHAEGGDSEPRYRCKVTIVGFDTQQHWCYRACPHCSSAVAANGHDYWCANHDTIATADTEFRYRIRLYVSDATADTVFVLLGLSAERIMPLSATELARAYPDDYGDLPPPISVLNKQSATFEVQLPRHVHANAHGDFKVSRAWGLVMNRAQLIAQLLPPPPLPPRSPSPPRCHDTPLPPDPRYVPSVPTYDPSLEATPELPILDLNLSKLHIATPSKSVAGPSAESDELPVSSLVRPKRYKAPAVPPPTPSLAKTHPGPSTPILPGTTKVHVAAPLLHTPPAQVLSSSVPPFTSLQQASLNLAASPLAKVKQECLSESPTSANPPCIDNTQTSSSLSRQGPRKRLFPS